MPEFEPSDKNQSAADWIDRVNSYAILYDWDDKTKLYLTVCRLRGYAKVRHNELHESRLSLLVFSHAIVRHFSVEFRVGILLKEAVLYENILSQDLQTYCFKKVVLCELRL